MIQPSRQFNAGNYRYGFNGKEKDDKGEFGMTAYDYGFRIYNPNIAKFLSIDPLTREYPFYTPYQFAGNKPIKFIDLDGLEEYDPMQDEFFLARLIVTTVFDVKHSIYNIAFASQGNDTRARYKFDPNGNEIFETEFYVREEPKDLKQAGIHALQDGLDILNLAGRGKIDASDFLSIKTGGRTQFTRGIREFLENVENRSFKNSFENGKYLMGKAKKDITVYKIHNKDADGGAFFTTVKPKNAAEAEDMLNIKMFGNNAEEVTTFTIKKGTEFSYGKVEGGSGDQIFIPKKLMNSGDVVKVKGSTKALPKN